MGHRLPINPEQDGDDESLSPGTNARSLLGTDATGATRRILTDGTGAIIISSNASPSNDPFLNLGDPAVDGSWRIIIAGVNLSIQKRESSQWIEKWAFTP